MDDGLTLWKERGQFVLRALEISGVHPVVVGEELLAIVTRSVTSAGSACEGYSASAREATAVSSRVVSSPASTPLAV
jgi:hypothetical protein